MVKSVAKKLDSVASERDVEIRNNYDAFKSLLYEGGLLERHRHEYALLRRGELVDIYSDPKDAMEAGLSLYSDRLFSIQEIRDTPVNLGYFSHVFSVGRDSG